jgi:hypothetical protein
VERWIFGIRVEALSSNREATDEIDEICGSAALFGSIEFFRDKGNITSCCGLFRDGFGASCGWSLFERLLFPSLEMRRVSDESDDSDLKVSHSPDRTHIIPIRQQQRGLSHEIIENIIHQKEQYLAYRRERDEMIWDDPDFRPGPLLDKIADRITVDLIKTGAVLLESTCDDFIDCLVKSEFFPDD